MSLLPIINERVQLSALPVVAFDNYQNGLLIDATASYCRVSASAGDATNNGLSMANSGQLIYYDATAGLPANVNYVNGIPCTSSGAICVANSPAVNYSNGLPFAANGALSALIQSALDTSIFANTTVSYSVRTPSGSNYNGPLVQVRRSSDNAAQNFYASLTLDVNGNRWLDTAAVLAFVGAGSGFVAVWYDQSGLGLNAAQSTSAFQPAIVESGVLVTDGLNPSIKFIQASQTRLPLPMLGVFTDAWAANIVCRTDVRSNTDWSDTLGTKSNIAATEPGWLVRRGFAADSGNLAATVTGGGVSKSLTGASQLYPYREVITLVRNPNMLSIYSNGGVSAQDATITPAMAPSEQNVVKIGGYGGTGRAMNGAVSEVIIFPRSLSDTERQTVEISQGTAFGITVV